MSRTLSQRTAMARYADTRRARVPHRGHLQVMVAAAAAFCHATVRALRGGAR